MRVAWFAILAALLSVAPVRASTVEDIRSGGVLTCGLDPDRPGFSVLAKDFTWSGFDVDLCRAVAAAVLGDASKVNLTALSVEERIVALQSGEIDVLLHGMAWTQGADARHGLMFVTPTFHGADIYGPMVRQGDDQWFHIVRGVVMALMVPPVDADKDVDAVLLLQNGWQTRALEASGSYRDLFARHFGPQTPFNMQVDAKTGMPAGIGSLVQP